jgi:hypothetical protein
VVVRDPGRRPAQFQTVLGLKRYPAVSGLGGRRGGRLPGPFLGLLQQAVRLVSVPIAPSVESVAHSRIGWNIFYAKTKRFLMPATGIPIALFSPRRLPVQPPARLIESGPAKMDACPVTGQALCRKKW